MKGLRDLVDARYEGWDPIQLANAPVDALQGVSSQDAVLLKKSLNIKTVSDLACNVYVNMAQQLVAMASTEVQALEESAHVGAAEAEFDAMLARIGKLAQVPDLVMDITLPQAAAQQELQQSTIPFQAALLIALKAFELGGLHPESPLSVVQNEWGVYGARERLLAFMNDDRATLSLVTGAEPRRGGNGQKVLPPEGAEALESNWMFHLRIPDLSDHHFWAVVPRRNGRIYSYGFN